MTKPGEQTLEEWVEENIGEITQAQAFSTEDMSDEPARLAQDLSRSNREFARMGFLLADAEGWVLKAHAVAVTETRKTHKDFTAEERKVIAKAEPTYLRVLKLRDDLAVIVAALKSKSFAIMNHRNNTTGAGMQE